MRYFTSMKLLFSYPSLDICRVGKPWKVFPPPWPNHNKTLPAIVVWVSEMWNSILDFFNEHLALELLEKLSFYLHRACWGRHRANHQLLRIQTLLQCYFTFQAQEILKYLSFYRFLYFNSVSYEILFTQYFVMTFFINSLMFTQVSLIFPQIFIEIENFRLRSRRDFRRMKFLCVAIEVRDWSWKCTGQGI